MKFKALFIILSAMCSSVVAMEEEVIVPLIEQNQPAEPIYSIGQYLHDNQHPMIYLNDDTRLYLNGLKINSLQGLGSVCDYLRKEKPISLNKITAISLEKNKFTSIDLQKDILDYLPACKKFYLAGNPLAQILNIKSLKECSYLDICSTDNDALKNNIMYTEFAAIPHSTILTNDTQIAAHINSKQNRPLRYVKHFGRMSLESFIVAYIFVGFLLNVNNIQGNRGLQEQVDMGIFMQKMGYGIGMSMYFAYMLFVSDLSKIEPIYGLSQHYRPHSITVKDNNS